MNKKGKNNSEKTENDICMEPSSWPNGGLPENAFQMVNNYGTYEIQATADTENQYPAIAQGFNKKIIKDDCIRKDAPDYKEFKE